MTVMSSVRGDELRSAGPPPAEDLLAIDLGPNTYYARVSLVAVLRAEGGCGPDEAVGEVPPVSGFRNGQSSRTWCTATQIVRLRTTMDARF